MINLLTDQPQDAHKYSPTRSAAVHRKMFEVEVNKDEFRPVVIPCKRLALPDDLFSALPGSIHRNAPVHTIIALFSLADKLEVYFFFSMPRLATNLPALANV